VLQVRELLLAPFFQGARPFLCLFQEADRLDAFSADLLAVLARRAGRPLPFLFLPGPTPRARDFPRRLRDATGGHPLRLEAAVEALIQSGDIRTDRRGGTLRPEGVDRIPVPAGSDAIAAERLARLPESARRLAGALALADVPVPAAALAGIAAERRPRGRRRRLPRRPRSPPRR